MKLARALLASLSLVCVEALVSAQDVSPEAKEKPSEGSATNKPSAPADEATRTAELDRLEQELSAVMDELVEARARASVIARGLFSTELAVEVVRRADDQQLAHLTLTLDGVPVHDSDGSALSHDRATLFTGYVAPGFHELGIELVENAKQSASFGYTRGERYRIEVKKERSTRVELVLRDDSDMAEEAAEGDHGEYELHSSVRVSSKPSNSKKARD
jgi:hypothetical protein